MNTAQKKILLGIDGSDQSIDAVRYVSKMLAPQNIDVTLYHVIKKIDDAFWEMGINPAFHSKIANIRAWEVGIERKASLFMNQAHQILIEAGFPQKAITVNIHKSKTGIARDIIEESKNDYNAIIVGRKGLNKLKDIVLGGTAHKLVEKLTNISVWVVGGKPSLGKVLLALDASEGAMKAVDYVGAMLGDSNSEITLLHVIRDINIFQQQDIDLSPSDLEAWAKEAKLEIRPLFDKAKTRLVDAGLAPDRITSKFIPGVSSRAGAIIEEARRGGYGSIVLGRRGISKVEEFFMGRVSNKVLHLAKEMAVWVVS